MVHAGAQPHIACCPDGFPWLAELGRPGALREEAELGKHYVCAQHILDIPSDALLWVLMPIARHDYIITLRV